MNGGAGYQSIAADLRRKIESGEWPPGTRLPTKRELAARYQVNPATIDHAMILLKAEGLVVGHRGIGTWVCLT